MGTKAGIDNHGYTGPEKTWEETEHETVKTKAKGKWTCCQITLLVLGCLCAVVGIVMLAGAYQAIFDIIFQNQLQLVPGGRAFDMWRTTPVPLFLSFYFFNLTNPKEFENGAVPLLEEIGPYCYREYHEKQNLTFYPNYTVSFYQQRWWIWDQDKSGNRTQEDELIILNTVPVSAAWSVRNNNALLSGLSAFLDQVDEQLTLTTTVGELVFEGVEDPLLTWMAKNFNNTFLPNLDLPPGLTDYDKFGWFYKRNRSLTYDGLWNMYTGEDTLDNVGRLKSVGGKNTPLSPIQEYTPVSYTRIHPCLPHMNTPLSPTHEYTPASYTRIHPCLLYKNTPLSPTHEYTRLLYKNTPLSPTQEYTPVSYTRIHLCLTPVRIEKTMKLFYEKETRDPNDLPCYRYEGTNHSFSYDGILDGDECYCIGETCAPVGTLNAESCRMGAPAFISFPHFYNADPELVANVTGMAPDEEKHAFYIDLLPETGTPVSVAARMQINMHVRPYTGNKLGFGRVRLLAKVSEVILPVLWFEEVAGLPEDLAKEMNTLLFIMNSPTITIIFSVMVGLGVIGVLIGLIRHYKVC
ncbi:hypothetical protein Pcinc_025297 [Petrolisthes cinctipes]|uniref:Scavenger receptor class B member 1 n=1 Tax=Petrolisthes cinctipes TaxID=88211 RepID=A0AAE1F9L5_PETCI|nr:hypothetical protein Pcinc_025297 [Petrolisthes cinctipes]